MASCSLLDSASLLAQRAVSLRLGRRGTGCSQALLATARRAPLHDSSVQGTAKQASTNASAPTQVLQSVDVDRLVQQQNSNGHAVDVHGLLTPRAQNGRRRPALVHNDGALQIALDSGAEHAVESLLPAVHYDGSREAPSQPELLASGAGSDVQHQAPEAHPHGDSERPVNGSSRQRARVPGTSSAASSEQVLGPRHAGSTQADGDEGGGAELPPSLSSAARQQPASTSGRSSSILRPRGRQPKRQSGGSIATRDPDPNADQGSALGDGASSESRNGSGGGAGSGGGGRTGGRQAGSSGRGPRSSGSSSALEQELVAEVLECRNCYSLQRLMQLHRPRLSPKLICEAVVHVSHLVAEEPPRDVQDRQAVAALLDDLMTRLRACGSSSSSSSGSAADAGSSNYGSGDVPSAASSSGSSSWAQALDNGDLAALVCALSKLRAYNGPLLREAAAEARQRVRAASGSGAGGGGVLRPRQAAGLIWAFARYHRDFRFALEPGWAGDMLTAVTSTGTSALAAPGSITGASVSSNKSSSSTPPAPAARAADIAMTLYGLALLNPGTNGSSSSHNLALGGSSGAEQLLPPAQGAGQDQAPPAEALQALLAASLAGLQGEPLASSPAAAAAAAAAAAGTGATTAADAAVVDRTATGAAAGPGPGSSSSSSTASSASTASRSGSASGGWSDWGGRELSMAAWALASLRHHPGPAWLAAFLARCEAATRSFGEGSAVASVLYGLAVLRARPPPGWMQHFLWQAQRRMNTMDGQSLAMTGWALARLRYRPDRKWVTAYLRYVRARVLQVGRDPATRLGLSTQERAAAPPPAEALAAAARRERLLLVQQQQRLQRLRQRTMGLGAAAATAVGAPAAPSAVDGVGGSAAQQPTPPQTYNVVLWSLVRLTVRPPRAWREAFLDSVQPRLGAFSPSEMSTLLWALAKLSWRPRDDWMLDACVAMRASLHRYGPSEAVLSLVALGRLCSALGYRAADGDLLDGLAGRIEPYLPRLQTTTLISVLLAASRVAPALPPQRLAPPLAALLARVRVSAAAAVGPGGGGSSYGSPTASRSSMDELDDVSAAAALLAAAAPAQPGQTQQLPQPAPASALVLTPRQCANAVFAVGCAARRAGRFPAVRQLCGSLLQELLPRVEVAAGGMNGTDLLLLLLGVAAARLRLSPDWLRRHETHAAARLAAGALTGLQLVELHRGYRALGYQPSVLPLPAAVAHAAAGQALRLAGGSGAAALAAAAAVELLEGEEDGGEYEEGEAGSGADSDEEDSEGEAEQREHARPRGKRHLRA